VSYDSVREARGQISLLIGEENQQVNGERPGALQSAGNFITGAT